MVNNLYLVISEPIEQYAGWACLLEPPETYCIAQLVVATSHKQALWLAWQEDDYSYTGDVNDRPKMSCNLRFKDCNRPVGIIRYVDGRDEPDKFGRFWYTGRFKGNDFQYDEELEEDS